MGRAAAGWSHLLIAAPALAVTVVACGRVRWATGSSTSPGAGLSGSAEPAVAAGTSVGSPTRGELGHGCSGACDVRAAQERLAHVQQAAAPGRSCSSTCRRPALTAATSRRRRRRPGRLGERFSSSRASASKAAPRQGSGLPGGRSPATTRVPARSVVAATRSGRRSPSPWIAGERSSKSPGNGSLVLSDDRAATGADALAGRAGQRRLVGPN